MTHDAAWGPKGARYKEAAGPRDALLLRDIDLHSGNQNHMRFRSAAGSQLDPPLH
jgi:hypothetical protein